MNSGRVIILTGEIGSGKSNLCLDVALKAKEGGVQLAGILSPAVFKEGEKTGIDLINFKELGTPESSCSTRSEKISLGNRKLVIFP